MSIFLLVCIQRSQHGIISDKARQSSLGSFGSFPVRHARARLDGDLTEVESVYQLEVERIVDNGRKDAENRVGRYSVKECVGTVGVFP
jgi:hypothetical protein